MNSSNVSISLYASRLSVLQGILVRFPRYQIEFLLSFFFFLLLSFETLN